MITVFNRREVFVSMDMESHANARDFLTEAGIKYTYKSKTMSDNRMIIGTIRSKIGGVLHTVQYRIFVHKKDFEKAKAVLTANYNKIFVN